MATIDERVVSLKFDNQQFKKAAGDTIGMLGRLKEALSFEKGKNAFGNLKNLSKSVDFSGVAKSAEDADSKIRLIPGSIQTVTGSFSALSAVSLGVFASIGAKAAAVGSQMASAFTIQPITDGFKEYELQMNSVQTILANTQAKGSTLKDVNETLGDLNQYADKTIYNFAEMTRNIGTFTAAGVGLETSKKAIKGIANLAAMSGSNSQQASTAMYQLSQAIAANKVGLMDWNSVVNAGMGGETFQKALFDTAKAMGRLNNIPMGQTFEDWKKAGNSFRDSLQEGWIDGEVLTSTLENFTGDLDEAALKAKGFNDQQVKDIMRQAETANDAATKVKTFTQLIDTMKEAVGSGWAQTWQTLIGDFEEAKELFTDINDVVSGFIEKSSDSRNELLKSWKDLGGRTKLIDGFKNIFNGLTSVLTPIKDAFRDIFPPVTVQNLLRATDAFSKFTEKLKISSETASKIKSTFRGVFAIFSILGQFISGIARGIASLFGASSGAASGFLSMTASVGEFLVRVDEALKKGDLFGTIFGNAGKVVGNIFSGLGGIFSYVGGVITNAFSYISVGLSHIKDAMTVIFTGNFSNGMLGGLSENHAAVKALQTIHNLLVKIKDSITNMSIGDILGALASGYTIKSSIDFIRQIKDFSSKVKGIFGDDGLVGSAKETLGNLTDALTAMQTEVKADILLKIAAAVGILAVSLALLSGIDAASMATGIAGIAALMLELTLALKYISIIGGIKGFYKIPFITSSLIFLAAAVLTLSLAVKAFGNMEWQTMIKGLVGVGIGLSILVGAINLLPKGAPLMQASAGLVLMATALVILSHAVENIGNLDTGVLIKGLAGVAATIAAISLAIRLMPTSNLLAIGTGLLLVSASMSMLTKAISSLGSLDVGSLVKGVLGLGGALVVIAGAMRLMPKGMVASATGLIVAATAINILTASLQNIGGMDAGGILKAIGGLGGAMIVLALGLNAMSGSLAGSAALMVASAAIAILVPSLKALGSMSLGEVVTALLTFAGAVAIMAGSAALLAPMLPAMLGLAGTFALFAFSAAAAGAGIFLIAKAFQLLGSVTGEQINNIANIFTLIPKVLINLGNGLVDFLVTIAGRAGDLAKSIGTLFVSVLGEILNVIAQLAPKIGEAFVSIASVILQSITALAPQIADSFIAVGSAILSAISELTPQLIDAFVVIISALIDSVVELSPQVGEAFVSILETILDTISSSISTLSQKGVEIIVALIDGISSMLGAVIDAGVNLIINFVNGISSAAPRIADAAANAVINGINAMASAIESNRGRLISAFMNLGDAMTGGMASGIMNGVGKVVSAAVSMAQKAMSAAKSALGINSPSKEFKKIGRWTTEGLAEGILKDKSAAKASGVMAKDVIDAARSTLDIHSPSREFKKIGNHVNQGMADGLAKSKDKPVKQMGENMDSVNKVAKDKSKETKKVVESIFDGIDTSSDNPLTKRLRLLAREAKRMREEAIEEREQAKQDREEKIYDDVENSLDAIDKARDDAKKAQEDADKIKKDAKKSAAEKERAQKKADRAKKAIVKKEKEHQKALRRKNKYEAEKAGIEEGEAYADGISSGARGKEKEVRSVGSYFVELLGLELEKAREKIDTFTNIFDGIASIRDTFKTTTSHIRDFTRAFVRMNNSTNPRSFRRNLGKMLDSFIGVGKGVGDVIDVFKKFAPAISLAFDGLDKHLPQIIGSVSSFAPELAGLLGGGMQGVLSAITGPIGGIVAAVTGLVIFFTDQANEGKILKSLTRVWNGVLDFLKGLPSKVVGFIQTILRGIVNTVRQIPELLPELIKGITDLVSALIPELPRLLLSLAGSLIKTLVQLIVETPGLLFNAGVGIIEALINGVEKAIDGLMNFILNPFETLKEAIGDSLSLENTGLKAIQSLTKGLGRLATSLWQLATMPFRKLYDFITGIFGLTEVGDGAIASLLRGIKNAFSKTIEFLTRPFKDFVKIITGELSLYEVGKNMLQGLVNGILNFSDSVIDFFSNLGSNILTAFKRVLGIRSPSREFRKIGNQILEGLDLGLDDSKHLPENKLKEIAEGLLDEFDKLESVDNLSPVITPVIDLSKVKTGVKTMNGLFSSGSVSVSGSYNSAVDVYSNRSGNVDNPQREMVQNITNINFTQNNTSPKALDTIDIYRNTKRELSNLESRM